MYYFWVCPYMLSENTAQIHRFFYTKVRDNNNGIKNSQRAYSPLLEAGFFNFAIFVKEGYRLEVDG